MFANFNFRNCKIFNHILPGEILSGETIRRAKFSSLNKRLVTFAYEKFRSMKVKVSLVSSTNEPKREKSHLDKFHYPGETLSGEIFVGRNIRH